MIPLIAPSFRQWMPHAIHPLIESGILLASLTTVLLNVFFSTVQKALHLLQCGLPAKLTRTEPRRFKTAWCTTRH